MAAEAMQKASAKRVRCLTSTQKFNTANGQQLAEREETELSGPCPVNFPCGVYMYGEMAGALRSLFLGPSTLKSQKQQQGEPGVGQESREAEQGEIHLSHGNAVFCGHSKPDA